MRLGLMALFALLIAATVGTSAQSKPAPATGPSLEETFKWLKDFLPSATGAKYGDAGGDMSISSSTAGLEANDGCKVVLTEDTVLYDQNGKAYSTVTRSDRQFSFSDIDPSTVSVTTNNSFKTPTIGVSISTRGGSRTVVVRIGTTTMHEPGAEAISFVDRASAERVAKAFRRAAELCANNQPF
jgi:hypothetical protein